MKLSYLMIATLALSAGAAQAQVQQLTGASASRNNVVLDLKNLCTGTFKVLKDSSSTSSPGNIFTAVCSAPFTGTAITEARFNVNGGSLNAVLAGPAPYATTALQFINGATVGCTPLVTTAPFAAIAMEHCNGIGLTAASPSEGGYMDVEGAVFKASGTLTGTVPPDTDFLPSSFQQTFGVAVTKQLYEALQEYQVAKGRLDASCATVTGTAPNLNYTATGLTTPLCQPSISRADFAAMSANGLNWAKRSGANWFIGGVTNNTGSPAATANDLPAGTTINTAVPLNTKFTLNRRQATSGTQAAAQLYFLNSPTGTGDVGGRLVHVGNAVTALPATGGTVNIGANFTVLTQGSSGNVVSALNGATGFAAAVLSLENNPLASGSNYRFVKINGQSGSEGTSTAAQTTDAIGGRYDFWYQTYKFCPNGTCPSILNALDGNIPQGAASPGIFRSTESNFTRDGSSAKPVVSKTTP